MASTKHLTLASSPQNPNPLSLCPFPLPTPIPTMKLIPGNLFKPKKTRSVSRSETNPSSFSSQASSEDVLKKPTGLSTPTSVLPSGSGEITSTDEWPHISADVYVELKQAFQMIDRNDDGRIQKEELEALLCGLGAEPPSQEELRLMLAKVDRDRDGCVTLEEFYEIGSAFGPPACDTEMRDTFDFFDSDHDGRITAEELLNVFRMIGDAQCTLEDCRRMIRVVDRNGDGFVCIEVFSLMMDCQLLR